MNPDLIRIVQAYDQQDQDPVIGKPDLAHTLAQAYAISIEQAYQLLEEMQRYPQ